MDSKRNWILVEASTSGSATPIHIRGSHRRSGPLMEHFRDEARLHTINRLNDRIHQRIMDNYRNGTSESIGEGAKVVDESFRFIEDEQSRINPEPLSNISDRLDSIVSRRNSQGEVEAVYERRLPSTSSRDDVLRPQPILRHPTSFEEPIYVKPAIRSLRSNRINASQPKPRMGLRRNGRDNRYRRTDSMGENVRYGRTEVISQYRRADSLDSGSLRIQRQRPPSRWSFYPERYPHYGRFQGDEAPREEWAEEPRPTFLRRTPQFYDKCDLCAFKIMRMGDHCPACGRTATAMRQEPPTIENDESYRKEEVLNAKNLSGFLRNEMMYRPPSKMYSTEFRKFYQVGHRTQPRRKARSPVFRYGSTIPEAMYDYSLWAKRQDRQALTMHAAILALVLFSTAFVVSAGVILLVTVT
ncbi:unnamed protein product [Strongylus vulgaris]|uniref:Uncharacterized protein n=1 Tax=Strongylus vulgaris TaxID=40348 RepID=A0A3P7KXG5_STRVU|nr:unnamed protein product [Strongylus vulgaris]